MTSTMLGVKIDRSDPTALHEQVAAQIRRSIAEGDAKPGERLPPAKDLAAVMHVNTNTVLRALRELREEGLLEFRRGSVAFGLHRLELPAEPIALGDHFFAKSVRLASICIRSISGSTPGCCRPRCRKQSTIRWRRRCRAGRSIRGWRRR